MLLTCDQWLEEAERCEAEGSPRTCEAIVNATVAMEVEVEDPLNTWTSGTEAAEARGRVGTARAILAYASRVFPDKQNLWRRSADLEKAHGTRQSLDAILERAVHHYPQAEVLWLMWVKEKWLTGGVPAAREVFEKVFDANPDSEQIWLAVIQARDREWRQAMARKLLIRARTVDDTVIETFAPRDSRAALEVTA